jgi:hypothetical protein
MAQQPSDQTAKPSKRWRLGLDLTATVAVLALSVSGLNFYRNFIYTKQHLEVTVTEVSYVTNEGALYMTVAFTNSGNRDAALLRAEPALWARRDETANAKRTPQWVALSDKVHPDIPVTSPKTPLVIKGGGVEVVSLSAVLDPSVAERARVEGQGGAFLGVRIATMDVDGSLYLLEHAVARLVLDRQGRIQHAEPAIHQSLSGFEDVKGAPPGDLLQSNKKTPFVWAEEHF